MIAAYSFCTSAFDGYCMHGGTCYDHLAYGKRCNCTAEFSGNQCQIPS